MPKRTDIKKILIIGSGPIIIGQACEFDYSGTQGCKSLREEGYEVVLVNSNPATIMTDPEFGDRTYIEPLVPEIVAEILRKERPDAILPTLGGQTGLNLAMDLYKMGVLEELGIELIGANAEAIERAEDRSKFKQICLDNGLDVPKSAFAYTISEANQVVEQVGLPCIVRPSFTLGGSGGGIAYNIEEFDEIARRGLALSPVNEIMVEECILGWKEFELEVMRDHANNFVVICSIENVDPMGVHTGDSITVAPAQTLTDKEYQGMRNDSRTVINAIGVDCGGSNIQFGVCPRTGRRVVIEMNPRVSRSSALASKATGFPIAKIAAKLAVGYRLDELPNDITRKTPACFEPTIDYVVTKIPRFAFEKFPGASPALGSQMKSVGETMAIGRNFRESLQKAMRSLETGRYGLGGDGKSTFRRPFLKSRLLTPNPERLLYVKDALKEGLTIQEIYEASGIDPWFLEQIRQIIDTENALKASKTLAFLLADDTPAAEREKFEKSQESVYARNLLRKAKEDGFSDWQIAWLTGRNKQGAVRALRERFGIKPVYKSVDTCSGEFEAQTPYYYSTYEQHNESVPSDRRKVIILGSGPNRIGQGIEFDYACVHAVLALRELGFETIMVNNNPETVSTDYDISDKLYFEPLTLEDVLNIVELENPEGVILQFGGQTPLKLARGLEQAGVRILGTSPESIDLAEDRERFANLLAELNIPSPPHAAGTSVEEVKALAQKIGLPVIVRPSYVLGGRGMEIVFEESQLDAFLSRVADISPEYPFFVDRFVEDATEADVDALCDGERVVIGAIMEHIELAGIHSGDSACVIPPRTLSAAALEKVRAYTEALAMALKVRGLINIQYAIKGDEVWVLEANPRASRTVPYVSKSLGVPLAKIATRIMAGQTLAEIGLTQEPRPHHHSVKEVVLPFDKFPGCEIVLGPEMRSTGEVMGVSPDYGVAFAKAQMAANNRLPGGGAIFVSIGDRDKAVFAPIARRFAEMGFKLFATPGTRDYLASQNVSAEMVAKISEGRPNMRDLAINNQIQLVINTPQGFVAEKDERIIRSTAIQRKIPLITTIAAARAAADGIEALRKHKIEVLALQDYHSDMSTRA